MNSGHRVSAPLKHRDIAPLPATRGPSFARGLWRIAAADVSSGNKVRLLHDGPQTFDAMLELIHAARHSVVLESYIVRSDEVGHRFSDALIAATRRGVSVRILTDWIGTRGTSRKFLHEMRKAGIDIRIFNAPGMRAWPFLDDGAACETRSRTVRFLASVARLPPGQDSLYYGAGNSRKLGTNSRRVEGLDQ